MANGIKEQINKIKKEIKEKEQKKEPDKRKIQKKISQIMVLGTAMSNNFYADKNKMNPY